MTVYSENFVLLSKKNKNIRHNFEWKISIPFKIEKSDSCPTQLIFRSLKIPTSEKVWIKFGA